MSFLPQTDIDAWWRLALGPGTDHLEVLATTRARATKISLVKGGAIIPKKHTKPLNSP